MKPDFTPVCVIVPVFRNLAATQRCIESVLDSETGPRSRLIVIDDASPEPEISSWCDQLAMREGVTVFRNPQNRGFVATVNRGIVTSAFGLGTRGFAVCGEGLADPAVHAVDLTATANLTPAVFVHHRSRQLLRGFGDVEEGGAVVNQTCMPITQGKFRKS